MNSKDIKKNNRFSIRKLTIGAASVLIGVTFMGIAGSQTQVHAADVSNQENSETDSSAKVTVRTPSIGTVDATIDYPETTVDGGKKVETKTPTIDVADKTQDTGTPITDTGKEEVKNIIKGDVQTDPDTRIKYQFDDRNNVISDGDTGNEFKLVVDSDDQNSRYAYLDTKSGQIKFVEVNDTDPNNITVKRDPNNNNDLVLSYAPNAKTKYEIKLKVDSTNTNILTVDQNDSTLTATIIVKAPVIDDGNDYVPQQTHTVNQTIIITNPNGLTSTDARAIVLTLQNGQWVSPDGTVFNEYPIPQIPGYDSYYKIGENGQLIKSTTVPAYSALDANGQPAADQTVYISYVKSETDNNDNDNNDVNKPSKKYVKITGKKTVMPTTTRVETYHAVKAAKTEAALPQAGESTNQAGLFGMAIAAIGSILGLAGFKKRKN